MHLCPALIDAPGDVDPLFLALQSVASTLFLIYSLRPRNRIFIAANRVAVANASGTLAASLPARGGH